MVLTYMFLGIILQGHILEINTRVTMASINLGLMVLMVLHSLMVLNKEVIGKAGVVIQTIIDGVTRMPNLLSNGAYCTKLSLQNHQSSE